ncbi:MAG: carboxypeptidase-like regulatory domain-containing protein [Actinomycetota bacterium]|nr:carboxypeptidase-like regulatory domain-containing protein [Actinomycetota bacterium]
MGTIPGFFVLTDSGGQTGYHESGVGFSLGRGVYAAAEFWSRGNALECTVHGVPVARWHRDTARAAVRQVGLVGNLPPARVSARVRAGRVSGSVTDSYGHPDVGVAVRLEQRTGTRWRSMRSGRTGTAGAYALRTRGSGTYRVVATLAVVSARSAPVRGR